MAELSKLFVALIAVVGPAPKNTPAKLQLRQGNQIIAIGDSITEHGGYLKDIDAVLAAQYPALKIPPIINAGISGQQSSDLVKRFQKDVVDKKPAVVMICIGINDVWYRMKEPFDEKSLAAYEQNVTKMVGMAQAAKISVILLTPTIIYELPDNDPNARLAKFAEAERQIAARKKCAVGDLHELFLTVVKNKNNDKDAPSLLVDDCHMSARGNALMAIGVLRALGVPDKKITIDDVTADKN